MGRVGLWRELFVTKTSDQSHSAPPTGDEGLRCPNCEYNLTGLVEETCPECGTPFDRRRLITKIHARLHSIPIWGERNSRGWIRSFIWTLIEIWIHPVRFSSRFPTSPNKSDARLFSRVCLFTSFILWMIALRNPFGPYWSTNFYIVGALIELIGLMYFCELLVRKLIFAPWRMFSNTRADDQRNDAFIRMTRAFLVLSSMATLLSNWPNSRMNRWYGLTIQDKSVWPTIAVFVYWWICVTIMAFVMTRKKSTFVRAMLFVPAVFFLILGITFFLEPISTFLYSRLARS